MMSRKRFLALPALVLAVGLVAGPADASRQDSWLGHPFMWHVNDVIAYPHRASMDDWQNAAAAVYVPEEANFSGGASASNGLLQGTATFGRDNWGIIIAGNDNRGYNPVKAIGAHERRPAEYLTMPYSAIFSTYGLDGGVSMMPRTQMQLGLGYGLEAVALGIFWTMAGSEDTNESQSGTNPVVKTGEEASYNSFTVSANLNTLSAFRSFELGLSFTTGSQEAFGDATDPDVGTGDNSAFALTWQAHLDREWIGWTPAFQFTYGQCSADWTEALDATETAPAPEDKLDQSIIRADFGGSKSWGNARVATNVGVHIENWEEEFKSGGAASTTTTFEDNFTVFPLCGASGEYWPRGWFGIDGGVLFAFNGGEEKFQFQDNTGTVQAKDDDTFKDYMTEFGFGFVFRIDREDWRADFAANVRNDVLGNPGQIVQGGNNGNPIFAVESSLYW